MTGPGGDPQPLGVALAWQCHPFEALLRLVRRAETLGFTAAFVDGDASQMGGATPRDVLDGWTVTTALLAQTRRIQIGSIRLVHHWNAARLAQSAATAARLFPGRLRFFVSIGGHPVDQAFGLSFPGPSERVRWLDETLAAVRALWRGEHVHTNGRYVTLSGAVVRPIPPPGTLPIAVAARAPSLLEVVAAHADIWDVNLPPIRARVLAAARLLAQACERRGRDPREIRRSQWIFTRAGDARATDPRIVAEFRRLNPWFGGIPDAELAEGIVAGPVAHCRTRILEIREDLDIELPVIDLSGLPEGTAGSQMEALAPSQSPVDPGV